MQPAHWAVWTNVFDVDCGRGRAAADPLSVALQQNTIRYDRVNMFGVREKAVG